jgi:hypothetical protein
MATPCSGAGAAGPGRCWRSQGGRSHCVRPGGGNLAGAPRGVRTTPPLVESCVPEDEYNNGQWLWGGYISNGEDEHRTCHDEPQEGPMRFEEGNGNLRSQIHNVVTYTYAAGREMRCKT